MKSRYQLIVALALAEDVAHFNAKAAAQAKAYRAELRGFGLTDEQINYRVLAYNQGRWR